MVRAPPWLARLLTPLFARHLARELSAKHPGLGPPEMADKMRAELQAKMGRAPNEAEVRLIESVAARFPKEGEARPVEKPLSAWVLVAANLVPLAGVLFWGWDAFALVALFWMENVVLGVFFALRMLSLDPRDPALWLGKLFMVPFFCVHYGMFTAIHGVFVFQMLGGKRYDAQGLSLLEPAARAAADFGLWLPLAVLFASHLFSFLWNYLYRGEFRRAQLAALMMQPYGRVVVLHVAILLGGFGAVALGSPLWALLVLLGMKIGLDLRAHAKEHSKS
ncbi:MAG TPA: DUF6498-containing protein [Burkholderiales bacterium]|nr:DUF6498-containing protein [Burkholderiales bacterium]